MILFYRDDPQTPPTKAERKRSIHIARRKSHILEESTLENLEGWVLKILGKKVSST